MTFVSLNDPTAPVDARAVLDLLTSHDGWWIGASALVYVLDRQGHFIDDARFQSTASDTWPTYYDSLVDYFSAVLKWLEDNGYAASIEDGYSTVYSRAEHADEVTE